MSCCAEALIVASVSGTTIHEALDLQWDDFEDSVQYVVGKAISADYIVTRNPSDFALSTIPVLSHFTRRLTEAELEEAREEVRLEAARRFLDAGVSPEIVAQCTGLSMETIRSLKRGKA
jgi:hypothetical protein